MPQPELTSRIAGAPTATQDREFDAQAGNLSTAAVDATVTTVGPELNVIRTYNSLDPRRAGAFGAGWNTRYDMRLVPDDDGSGNVVVTYPDGQAVRFGKNPNGTYAAPAGRTAQLTVDSTAWRLIDKSRTTYQFSLSGQLNKITDATLRSVVLSYNTDRREAGKGSGLRQPDQHRRAVAQLHLDRRRIHQGDDRPGRRVGVELDLQLHRRSAHQVCAPGSICTTYSYDARGRTTAAAVLTPGRSRTGGSARPRAPARPARSRSTSARMPAPTAAPPSVPSAPWPARAHRRLLQRHVVPAGAAQGPAEEEPRRRRRAVVQGRHDRDRRPAGSATRTRRWAAHPTAGGPLLYVGTDGRLRGQFGGGIPRSPPPSRSTTASGTRWCSPRWAHPDPVPRREEGRRGDRRAPSSTRC